ncbi:MAG TPA: ABC transporter permease [Ktedonobacterales bacterium]|nr:ABC transporter permease [Ktedonobacterales bacterium]
MRFFTGRSESVFFAQQPDFSGGADLAPAPVGGPLPELPDLLDREISIETRKATLPARVIRAVREEPRWLLSIILGLLVVAAIFAPWIAPYDPLAYHPSIASQPPTPAHPFGTDSLGRDQLSRVIYGTRISLSVGIVSILLGGGIGTVLGLVGGYLKGWVDQSLAIVVDALLAFPSLILALAIAASLGTSVANLVIALAVVRIPIYARLARGQVLQVEALDYVTAARASGTRTGKILFRHVLPNIISPLLVQATISISFAILDESVLSYLGLGSQPPTPEWGTMINEAQTYLITDPWMMLGPALAIIVTVLSLNLVGDALRDRLDPRSWTRLSVGTSQ